MYLKPFDPRISKYIHYLNQDFVLYNYSVDYLTALLDVECLKIHSKTVFLDTQDTYKEGIKKFSKVK